MPYINELNSALNLYYEQLTNINNILVTLYNKYTTNFLLTIEDLIAILSKKKTHNALMHCQEFNTLIALALDNKAIEDEIIRKCELIKFLYSAKQDTRIPIKDYNQFCQFICSQQEMTIEQLVNNLLYANLHESIFNALMETIPGYLFVKDALPKCLINIFQAEELKKPQIPRIKELQFLAGDIASSLGENLVYSNQTNLFVEQSTQHRIKPKACREIKYDDDIEMQELNSNQNNNKKNIPNSDKLEPPKIYPLRMHKAFIQILFFKHIASDPRVIQLANNKIHPATQQTIERICTTISNYAHPQQTSAYETESGFKINHFVKNNETAFWNSINQSRNFRQKIELENRNSTTDKNLNTQVRNIINDIQHAEYTEIPDSSEEQQSKLVEHTKVAKPF